MVDPKQRISRRATDHVTLRERGIYLLPNLFTSAALFSGFYAIVQAMNAKYELAAIAIFIAMVMDGLDGRVARMTNTQSAFGAEYTAAHGQIGLDCCILILCLCGFTFSTL